MIRPPKSLLVKLFASAVAVASLTLAPATGPQKLEASTECGRYDANLCQTYCTRECVSGGCCGWSYYYYERIQDPT